MKKPAVAVILAGGVILISSSAFGQAVANDLYLGFQNQAGGGTQDYIINLGPASAITNSSSVVNLSSDFSMSNFNTVLGTSSSMFGGVIGAANNNNPSDIFLTQLRSGGAGNPAVPGSSVTATMSRANDNSTFADLGTLASPTAGTGTLDTSKSWESDVEPTLTAASFYGQTTINPDSPVSPSTVLYEDLWVTSRSSISGTSPYVYLGYFTLDLTGASPKLTFTSTKVPASLTPPLFLSISTATNTATLVWSTIAGYHYQLQHTASLSPTNWTDIGSLQLAGGMTMTNTDSSATNSQGFYRVRAQ